MKSKLRFIDLVTAATLVVLLIGIGLVMRGERVAGTAYAIDGDTISLEGRRIRLKGLDAPEMAQTCEKAGQRYRCGEDARDAVRAMIGRKPVSCVTRGRDRYDRALGTCAVEGQDIGASLVRRGLAVAYGAYEAEEREARDARAGLWAGAFERPSLWRKRQGGTDRD